MTKVITKLFKWIKKEYENNRNTENNNDHLADLAKVGEIWSSYSLTKREGRFWWQSDLVKKHINMMVFSTDSAIQSMGANLLLAECLNGRQLKLGVSVGCGEASKELQLLQMDIVEKFILFDLSQVRIERGLENAERLNLSGRVEFHSTDAFLHRFDEDVDLVHWNNSLHHMFDVSAAVKWSKDILKSGGVFFMDDYVGANRFQYPQSHIDLINGVLQEIPLKYLKDPYNDSYRNHYANMDPAIIIDPSEAVDSQRILQSIRTHFPQAKIIRTGGLIYWVALGELFCNFDEDNKEDVAVLTKLLECDAAYSQDENIISPYAIAIATK